MKTLVALPVFNEEHYVARVLRQIARFASDVLVIDDGSTDGTPAILAGTSGIEVIRHPENRGYGQSLIDSFDYAAAEGYDWIIAIDCDEQHEPARIPAFLEEAAGDAVDVVSGSRYLLPVPGNTTAPPDRQRINACITEILNKTLGMRLTDAFCGFKAYRVDALLRLSLSVPGYAFPLQFWVQAAFHGLRIREFPVELIYHDPTRHFGGQLDDPDARLQHYLDVFNAELAKVASFAPSPHEALRLRCRRTPCGKTR